jgi:hypothetical protein
MSRIEESVSLTSFEICVFGRSSQAVAARTTKAHRTECNSLLDEFGSENLPAFRANKRVRSIVNFSSKHVTEYAELDKFTVSHSAFARKISYEAKVSAEGILDAFMGNFLDIVQYEPMSC